MKELPENRVISLNHMKSKKNLVDSLTEGLCRKMVFFTSRGIGVRPIDEL